MTTANHNNNKQNRCVGFNISMPLAELDKVDQTARRLGISRSELMRRAFSEFSSRNML